MNERRGAGGGALPSPAPWRGGPLDGKSYASLPLRGAKREPRLDAERGAIKTGTISASALRVEIGLWGTTGLIR